VTALDERPADTPAAPEPDPYIPPPDSVWRAAFLAGHALGYRHGHEDAAAHAAEDFARLRDWVLPSASPRSQCYAARREAEARRAAEGPSLTPEQIAQRARDSMNALPARPDPPAGLPPITWDGTWKPKRPDAIWTAEQERTHRWHTRKADAA